MSVKFKFEIFSEKMAESEEFMSKIMEPFIHISVTCPDQECAKISINEYNVGTLYLKFHDVDPIAHTLKGYENIYIPMSDEQGIQILEFVDKHYEDVNLIVVNCLAGISRSSGIAMALSRLYNGHSKGIDDNQRFHPNMHVVTTLMRLVREDKFTISPERLKW